ncbi:MAG TPA: hypothetical protein VFH31_03220 [Pyrinomonadaceae bacterium]|nr:hypothetical protein [Pyrinomonadaceae bacterium]
MKSVLNPTVALITFVIGVCLTGIWHMNWRTDSQIPKDCSSSSKVITVPTISTETEQYAVLSAVIKDMYLEDRIRMLVIHAGDDCQSPKEIDDDSDEKVEELRRMEEWAIKEMPALKHDTIENFHSKTQPCLSLVRKLDIPVIYVLVSDEDLKSLFPEGEFDLLWRKFYARFPNSSGLINFARIAFNDQMNQALVMAGRRCGGLCGEGYLVLLAKGQGVWKVQSKVCTWVS